MDPPSWLGDQTFVLVGRVLGPNTIYLLFPTDPNASRITFERR